MEADSTVQVWPGLRANAIYTETAGTMTANVAGMYQVAFNGFTSTQCTGPLYHGFSINSRVEIGGGSLSVTSRPCGTNRYKPVSASRTLFLNKGDTVQFILWAVGETRNYFLQNDGGLSAALLAAAK